ncbi:nucleotidyltransferase domain-containing protein [Synoicihabitans lomoniglobus]|uniref:Nucleotidyltransferase domain-containing protein n=1 Tax=Synoicihabitans lomoniglobus TaxID=2909285 RepID=A0AAF0CP76_9BACT|nr:nucleotidyltransferase domain-containing protein [Opitutaceae bacterium LMO-M01]WED63514.1 nucleotidyltransferase domain-containing protein [Opitutaceae bacterium LMO-M01]
MYPHHQETIANAERVFAAEPDVIALLVGGSIAHGLARETSDVDIMIVVSPESYAARKARDEPLYLNFEHSTYEGGYIDGKYLDIPFMAQVADRGSEAARYAFQDAIVVFSRDDQIPALISRIVRFPVEKKADNIRRFLAQMNAWKWMAQEGRKHGNRYIVRRAIDNFILFSSRVILAHNERLYPFHKWMLREVERAPDRPADMLAMIDRILDESSAESVEALFSAVKATTTVEFDDATWGRWFQRDNELNWLDHEPPVADL